MGFLKHLRSRSNLKDKSKNHGPQAHVYTSHHHPPPLTYRGRDCTEQLPDKVLRRIFELVCPHTTDDSYETSEKSMIGDGCMLCDLRDLASCAQVRRRWYGAAQGLLYKCVRIDAVHYCELEEILTQNRRRKSRHETTDVPTARLQLFARTVRANQYLAETVELLKLPYMTRETSKADLARTVSVLPNLRYVDLPDGFYSGDLGSHTLRQEMQARCSNIRKMKYDAGAEQLFEMLLQGYWQRIEILELNRLKVEPMTLRRIIACLPSLVELKISESPWLNDSVFASAPNVVEFPALERLKLDEMPGITAKGLCTYLSHRENSTRLNYLSLASTGVTVDELHTVLSAAPYVRELAITATVSTSLPMQARPPLRSLMLRTLYFEITSASNAFQGLQPPHSSYYAYLITSLLTNSLPSLKDLSRGLTQPLNIYAKGLDELDWIFSTFQPAEEPGRRGSFSGGRPLSAYDASRGLGPQWGNDNRKSVVVGNGFGGFLAVPADMPERPKSAGSWTKGNQSGGHFKGHSRADSYNFKRASRADLWR
ncbi:Vps54-like protein [Neofusicoccum parvum]|uniref:Vps54-like protein n=2 Tax=Neofusicoccum parvum TaxID=310453 RepID=A0ACB5SI65_9PEZI|nr:putative f-box domain protein [Neofusicoccum parvum UCRNP2]GME41824.1 Vps54-like protein [Neofusicoccum parvum]GME60450.1 Vps54-like protein [Neofusicoccum parvum]